MYVNFSAIHLKECLLSREDGCTGSMIGFSFVRISSLSEKLFFYKSPSSLNLTISICGCFASIEIDESDHICVGFNCLSLP